MCIFGALSNTSVLYFNYIREKSAISLAETEIAKLSSSYQNSPNGSVALLVIDFVGKLSL